MKHKFSFLLFVILLPLLLAACKSVDPQPLTQEQLDAINCQTGDLPRKQTYIALDPRAIPLTNFLGQDPVLTSTRTWNDISSTHQSFSCTILVFSNVEAARQAYQLACNFFKPPFKFPNFGDLACQAGNQEVNLVYQRENYVVWIWADYEGVGIKDIAGNLDERLILPVVLP